MASIASLVIVFAQSDTSSLWLVFWATLSLLFYLAQLVEVAYCQTLRLLWCQPSWDNLEQFRRWFYDLKKCRPVVTFRYTPD